MKNTRALLRFVAPIPLLAAAIGSMPPLVSRPLGQSNAMPGTPSTPSTPSARTTNRPAMKSAPSGYTGEYIAFALPEPARASQ